VWPLIRSTSLAVFLCLASRLAADAPDLPGNQKSKTILPLEINRRFGLLLVHVEVNDKPATFVVDTGANRTAVSDRLIPVQKSGNVKEVIPEKSSGYLGHAVPVKANLQIGNTNFDNYDLLAMDMTELSRSLDQNVDGLLGEDILREFNVLQFDFKNRSFILFK
jgi:hypothetical protein